MKFEKVEKTHILQGIKDFKEKGLPIGFGPSSTYDLVFEGKRYPPKAVMVYANHHATGRKIERYFKGGIGTDCFLAFEQNGFDVIPKRQEIESEIVKKEFAKWLLEFAPSNYQPFYGKTINSVITKLNEINAFFDKDLFAVNINNYKEMISHISFINSKAQRLKRQDFYSYDKKHSNGIPIAILGKKNYYEFLYHFFNRTNYWVFQSNSAKDNFSEALVLNKYLNFNIKNHIDEVKIGDKVIIWITGENARCYALAEVITLPSTTEGTTNLETNQKPNRKIFKVKIKITHFFKENPITKDFINGEPDLKGLKVGIQGTNFTATKEQYDYFLNHIDAEQPLDAILASYDSANLKTYFNFLFKILDYFDLKPGNPKLHYSTKRNRISFTIGQRFSWVLYKKNNQGKFLVLSKNKIKENSIQFSGNKPYPYYTHINNCEFSKSELESIFSGFEQELQRGTRSSYRALTNVELEEAVFDPVFRASFSTFSTKKRTMTPLNIILYGPPGTGKTFNTVNRALEICGESIDGLDRKEIKELYDLKVAEGQIIFTTFHQSMSYEDFIEGIKPIEPEKEGDPVIYKVIEGIFKKACIEASFNFAIDNNDTDTDKVLDFSLAYDNFIQKLEERLASETEVELEIKNGGKVYVDSISQQGNIQIKHLEGLRTYTVSKTRLSKLQKAITNLDEISNINDSFRAIIGGSNSTAYWSVLNAIQKENHFENNLNSTERKYSQEEKREAVKELDKNIYKGNTGKPIVLIIDEINRGNVSAIFGELITLIEKDKRLGADEALMAQLPYSKETFGVPPNLYIIGTMNTADRSVEALDSALRRRFSFTEMPPKPKLIKEVGSADNGVVEDVNLVKILKTINNRIEKLLDRDHAIGHSYFLKVKNLKQLKAVFANKVIPLLQEYFFGDYGKIGLVLGSDFVKSIQDNNEDGFFASFEDYDLGTLLERKVYRIKDATEMNNEDFKKALLKLIG
ncbi:MAG: AAA family ATPase [Maribacter litoralis]|uniref:AAA family ATPase n=1 Tax=Maribacter litoralis TaxID=2059726 RepID=UPI003298C4E9